MEKELKEYLERISDEILGVRDEIARVDKSLSAKIDKVEKKLAKKIDDNIDYTKLLDRDLSEHRRNTEIHNKKLRKA